MVTQTRVLQRVGNLAGLREGRILRRDVGGSEILLIKKGRHVYAIGSCCGRGCASLADGIVEGFFIRCPWYHEYYDIRTGRPVGPSCCKSGIRVYGTKVDEKSGDVFVDLDTAGNRCR
ncbi:MAG: Rieske 2Fe-2S domain-containing protein [Thaumarchaeota archaeon]|nr:Rieske 2Fe-2S domain-containing protein [Nitrososphaerota archaeon]